MIFKIIFYLVFIPILFLLFLKFPIVNLLLNISQIFLIKNEIFITNKKIMFIRIETSGNDGIFISMTSIVVGSSPTYYSQLRMTN